MKKVTFAICLIAFALINSAQAQVVTLCSASQHVFSSRADAIAALKSALPSHMYLNELNMRATRDFLKRFQNPTDVQWSKSCRGYQVSCTDQGIKCRTAYTNNGGWLYTVRSYDEWKLPKDVRALVRSTYYDYHITQVDEILQHGNEEPIYLVHMKDERSWKNVMVKDGEIIEREEYVRG
jgi:hypothetical protein